MKTVYTVWHHNAGEYEDKSITLIAVCIDRQLAKLAAERYARKKVNRSFFVKSEWKMRHEHAGVKTVHYFQGTDYGYKGHGQHQCMLVVEEPLLATVTDLKKV